MSTVAKWYGARLEIEGLQNSSLTGGTALCLLARHFILYLGQVQHRNTRHNMTENC